MFALQSLENEVDQWIPSFDELTELRRKLGEENPGDGELLRHRDNELRQLHERWDELVRNMEQKSNNVIITFIYLFIFTGGQFNGAIDMCSSRCDFTSNNEIGGVVVRASDF